MSASGGPAADNNELRAQLKAAISDPGSFLPRRDWREPLSVWIRDAIWPLVVAFGDARYQEGRNDAGDAVEAEHVAARQAWERRPHEDDYMDGRMHALGHAADVARGEG